LADARGSALGNFRRFETRHLLRDGQFHAYGKLWAHMKPSTESISNLPDLVIFDCDGVLVDSEPLSNAIFATMLNERGLAVTLGDMYEWFLGRSMPQCMAKVRELLGHEPPDGFLDEYRRRVFQAFRLGLKAVPGISAVLDALDARGLPYCVASSGEPEKIRETLGTTGLLPRFEGRVFSVVEVENPKPAPDVFLYAARRLGARPERCVVVEDTPTGVAAGVKAGMTVFGHAALTPARSLVEAGAHRVFADMGELVGMIQV